MGGSDKYLDGQEATDRAVTCSEYNSRGSTDIPCLQPIGMHFSFQPECSIIYTAGAEQPALRTGLDVIVWKLAPVSSPLYIAVWSQ